MRTAIEDASELMERKRQEELAEVSEMLNRGPLRNKTHVEEFNRLMMKVDEFDFRRRMVEHLLGTGDEILRLFVARQGVGIISMWMVVPSVVAVEQEAEWNMLHRITLLLQKLPIGNRGLVEGTNAEKTLGELRDVVGGGRGRGRVRFLKIQNFQTDPLIIAELLDSVVTRVTEDPRPRALSLLFHTVEESKANATELLSKWSQLSQFKIPKRAPAHESKPMDDDCGRVEGRRGAYKKLHVYLL